LAWIAFERELSQISVRGRDGHIVHYPLAQNEHEGGILRQSYAPAPNVSAAMTKQARTFTERVMHELNYVGVLALELFVVGDGLIANEMAPRVHNSGHWTIEGAITSQFENHLRAVTGLPLGSAEAIGPSAMVNAIGVLPDRAQVLAIPDAHFHDYGKQPRPGRKVGHVTVRAPDWPTLEQRVEQVRQLCLEATA
jgi:5-(carboxyamino)imidazole ribonucleotide synthase